LSGAIDGKEARPGREYHEIQVNLRFPTRSLTDAFKEKSPFQLAVAGMSPLIQNPGTRRAVLRQKSIAIKA
jgi:hypothetical protein